MKKKLYNDEGVAYTPECAEMVTAINSKIYAIIEQYADELDRVEFEHMMLTELQMQFALYSINKRFEAKKTIRKPARAKAASPEIAAQRVFKKGVNVKGALISAYSFENQEAVDEWLKSVLPVLEKQYGKLEHTTYELDGLKVGDRCHVVGEGDVEFKIEKVIKYSEDRWGFVLDSGWTEEVVKCYGI